MRYIHITYKVSGRTKTDFAIRLHPQNGLAAYQLCRKDGSITDKVLLEKKGTVKEQNARMNRKYCELEIAGDVKSNEHDGKRQLRV